MPSSDENQQVLRLKTTIVALVSFGIGIALLTLARTIADTPTGRGSRSGRSVSSAASWSAPASSVSRGTTSTARTANDEKMLAFAGY